MNTLKKIFLFVVCGYVFSTTGISVQAVEISIPAISVIQGDPAQIIIEGIENTSEIKSITIENKKLSPFIYQGKVQVVYGVDIAHTTGAFPIVVTLKNKKTISGTLTVLERKKPIADFTIPADLGGTTPQGEKNVLSLLAKENKILSTLWTNPKKLWSAPFQYPVKNPEITDPYGYSRDTGTTLITHKGTDFRALNNAPIYAVNRGVVRLVRSFALYGNTVIIDHGQGIMTFYMHLSNVSVRQGYLVTQGQKIGESGQTGYAEGEHLHLTVRVNNTSIDPMSFFAKYGAPLNN